MRTLTTLTLLAAFAACSISEAKVPSEVSVELASVTLADDCPGLAGATPTPPGKFAKPPPGARSERRAPGAARGDCARADGCTPRRQACEQTSMQLAIRTQAGVRPTRVTIKRVELLDMKGKVLEVLTARAPRQWSARASAYVAWDETLDADEIVRATYNLDAPDWNKLTGGRLNAHAHTFQLRVVVQIGDSRRTIEKTSITPARIAPVVVT